ncbi:unnamed protein product [Brassica napus]|uniref:(rape) hypothetical protein n=1 Tax=Brassica napus TaxID=3708 RepID=A0A816WP05_BRANA|nr:unnamed protein product [Brassica napus]
MFHFPPSESAATDLDQLQSTYSSYVIISSGFLIIPYCRFITVKAGLGEVVCMMRSAAYQAKKRCNNVQLAQETVAHRQAHALERLHVKNLILQEKRLVRFLQSSGTVMIMRKQSIPRKTITTDKQDSCLNQVHGVCFGMRLRQEPSPGFTAGRQYKTADSRIAKGTFSHIGLIHRPVSLIAQASGNISFNLTLHHHPPCMTNTQRFTLRAPLNPKPQQVVAQTVAYEVSPSSSITVGVRQLDHVEPK